MTSEEQATTATPDWSKAKLAALFAVTFAFFAPTIVSFHYVWNSEPYTHGYLLALVTLWFIWRQRTLFASRPGLWTPPLFFAAGLSLVWLLGSITSVRFLGQAALPLLALAWTAALFGPEAVRRLGSVAGIFLLGVPFWLILNPALQFLTAKVSAGSLAPLGIPAVIEGSLIHLTYGSFFVAASCSGLNYFMSGVALAAIYGQEFMRTWHARLRLVGLAAAVAILANWIRVTSLIVIGHVTRMESSLIEDHKMYGWMIFFVGLILLVPAARMLEKQEWARLTAPAGDALDAAEDAPDTTEEAQHATADDPEPIVDATQPWQGRTGPTSLRPALLASAVVVLGPVVHFGIGALPARDVAPVAIGAGEPTWTQTDAPAQPAPAWTPAFVGADTHVRTFWTSGDGQVTVDRLEYRDQAQGAELIGYPNTIADEEVFLTERLFGPVGPKRMFFNEAVVREGDGILLVWYWYRVGGIETSSPAKAKLLEIPAFFGRTPVSELLAASTLCEPDDCAEAFRRLSEFFGA